MRILEAKSTRVIGGGSGIGRASCLLVAREGAQLIVADINREAAEETAALIRSEGSEARAVVADLNRVEQDRAVFDAAIEAYGCDQASFVTGTTLAIDGGYTS